MLLHRRSTAIGFTVVELVVVITIVGIIALVAIPRFVGVDSFQSRGFYDRATSVVRQAHKTAIAQRRPVFVVVSADRVAVCYDGACASRVSMSSEFGFTPSMESALAKCLNDKTWLCAGTPDGVSLSTVTFSFDGAGRPNPNAAVTITLTSTIPDDPVRQIVVERETGYVHP
jgi:MSHA pilin protein MshC